MKRILLMGMMGLMGLLGSEAAAQAPVLAKGEESKVEGILSVLYEHYAAHPEALPEDLLGVVEREGRERAAVDYISGMTDSYAMEKFGELFIPFAWTVK